MCIILWDVPYAGEFGIVYKGVLTDWNSVPMQGVAVKTLKGNCINVHVYIYIIYMHA